MRCLQAGVAFRVVVSMFAIGCSSEGPDDSLNVTTTTALMPEATTTTSTTGGGPSVAEGVVSWASW